MTEREDDGNYCDLCTGTGECQHCSVRDDHCPTCEDSGICIDCDGTGEQ